MWIITFNGRHIPRPLTSDEARRWLIILARFFAGATLKLVEVSALAGETPAGPATTGASPWPL